MPKDLVINNGKLDTTKLVGAPNVRQINYILNPDAEVDTTGWATYADAAQATPVDGTGGSPQASLWVRSTTSPLRGTGSFRLDKTGSASRQGQGASYSFTIDKADTAKVLTVSFDYEVAAGTYADGDVTVYIYDVTNATVIQPAGYIVQSVASGVENKHIATFQTHATSTSYRLILHIASTSAQNYTLAIDNVTVGPQTVQYGAPITDWVSFTPTINWSATSSTNVGKWRRVGDSVEIETRLVLNGAPTGNFTFTLPFGWSIDSTKANSLSGGYCGVANIDDFGSGAHQMNILIISSTQVQPYGDDSSGALSPTIPFTLGNTDVVNLLVRVPISGWSSTVQMSNDTDTRVVAAKQTAGATQSIANNTTAILNATPSNVYDTHGGYSTSTGRYTVPVQGYYKVQAFTQTNGTYANSGSYTQLLLFKNGVTDTVLQSYQALVTSQALNNQVLSAGTTVFANAGDILDFRFSNFSGGSVTVATYVCSLERLSGPSAIAATETVAASYTFTSGAQTSNDNFQNLPTPTILINTHGAINTTTGEFTVPVAGLYRTSCKVCFQVNATGLRAVRLLKNEENAIVGTGTLGNSSAEILNAADATTLVQCVAGDKLRWQAYQNSGASRNYATTAGFNIVNFEKVR